VLRVGGEPGAVALVGHRRLLDSGCPMSLGMPAVHGIGGSDGSRAGGNP
jgi:hypothetical protein